MRILIAGILGGVAMFIWSTIAHLSPLGQAGVKVLPNESTTLANLSSAMGGEGGLFLFPMQMDDKTSAAAGPGGFLVYRPDMPLAMTPSNLIVEFLTEVVESIIAAWLLAQAALTTYGRRVGFVSMVGVVGAIVTNVPYWNWYHFPLDYTLAYSFVEIVAFVAAGLVMAWYLKPKPA